MKNFVSISRTEGVYISNTYILHVISKKSKLADNHTFHKDAFLIKSRKALNSALTTE